MYREYQIYDDDVETIDLEAAKKLLNEQIVNEEFNPVYGQAFERCSKFGKGCRICDFCVFTFKSKFLIFV